MLTGNRRLRGFVIAFAATAILVLPRLLNLITNLPLQARYPVPGAFYRVNGRRMHLYCTGQGSPTVVLDAGGGDDWLIWQLHLPFLPLPRSERLGVQSSFLVDNLHNEE